MLTRKELWIRLFFVAWIGFFKLKSWILAVIFGLTLLGQCVIITFAVAGRLAPAVKPELGCCSKELALLWQFSFGKLRGPYRDLFGASLSRLSLTRKRFLCRSHRPRTICRQLYKRLRLYNCDSIGAGAPVTNPFGICTAFFENWTVIGRAGQLS